MFQIKVEFSTATKTKEETKAVGLITIQTLKERNYEITTVIDATTAEKLDLLQAYERGIIDEEQEHFTVLTTNETIPIEAAIQQGWVVVKYDDDTEENQIETKMYAVSAVVDQKMKKKVPFYDAVCRGLIDKQSGNYVNNVTGETTYVPEAIKRGFLKAREIQDTKGLNIEAENKVVIERMDKMRKNVLKSVGVLNAFRKAAQSKNNK